MLGTLAFVTIPWVRISHRACRHQRVPEPDSTLSPVPFSKTWLPLTVARAYTQCGVRRRVATHGSRYCRSAYSKYIQVSSQLSWGQGRGGGRGSTQTHRQRQAHTLHTLHTAGSSTDRDLVGSQSLSPHACVYCSLSLLCMRDTNPLLSCNTNTQPHIGLCPVRTVGK